LESAWHRDEINLLVELVRQHFDDRDDFFAGGNMFIYYNLEQARNREYRGPDFFYVKGADRFRLRPYWAVWEEGGKFPNVIIELLSPTTAREDRTTKKDLYETTFATPDYFLYDPDTRHLEGWRLRNGRYTAIPPDERGWLWSEELGLWLGTWDGAFQSQTATWLRFFDAQGQLVPLYGEKAAQRAEQERQRAEQERQRAKLERQRVKRERERVKQERQRAEQERQRAEQQEQRAEQERQRADREKQRAQRERHRVKQERQRAEQERQRAEALAAELARLKALVQEKAAGDQAPPPAGGPS
jgi:Uma2 family endonuclease